MVGLDKFKLGVESGDLFWGRPFIASYKFWPYELGDVALSWAPSDNQRFNGQ
jgi:hypothetical protein